ncbi:hypothetical protein V6N13_024999 [Hibiscus sabdariffa]
MEAVLMQFQTKDPESARAAEQAPAEIPASAGKENTKRDAISSAYFSTQDSLSLPRHPLCHPTRVDYQSNNIDEVEALIVESDAITV